MLEGIRVLELGQVLSAPFAGAILGDLGAEVLKIERVDGGDDVDANFARTDQGNVDPAIRQCAEHAGCHPGVRSHAHAGQRQLGHPGLDFDGPNASPGSFGRPAATGEGTEDLSVPEMLRLASPRLR